MIKYSQGKKIAALDANENAVVKVEDTLRIVSQHIDFISREVRLMMMRGYVQDDGTFKVTNTEPVIVTISDGYVSPAVTDVETDKDGNQSVRVLKEAQNIPLFTLLITPGKDQGGREHGDFRLSDIEQMIIDNNLLSQAFDVDGRIQQK